MASLMPICRAVTFVADGLNLAAEISKIAESRSASKVEQASIYNTITGIGLKLLEFAGLAYGASPSQLQSVKTGECFVKVINIPLSVFKALKNNCSTLEVVEKGVIAPVGDLMRACSEAGIYQERCYMEALAKDPTATRPYIISCDSDGAATYGQKPIDLSECKRNVETRETVTVAATTVKIVGELGVASRE